MPNDKARHFLDKTFLKTFRLGIAEHLDLLVVEADVDPAGDDADGGRDAAPLPNHLRHPATHLQVPLVQISTCQLAKP